MSSASEPIDIDLMADYCDWPLRGPNGLLGEHDLPLPDELKQRIKAWFNAFDEFPRSNWPLWSPPPGTNGTDAEEEAWTREGEVLRGLIELELGPGYRVWYQRER